MSDKPFSYKAGAARVRITPDEPLWLAGYASRTAPARGKISDLYASALVLEDGAGQRFAIVSADLIAITPTISVPVVAAVERQYGLTRQQILLTATHTHYGPEFRADKQVFFKIPAEYAEKIPHVVNRLADALVRAIGEANAQLEPVRIITRKTTVNFAHNRRRHGVVAGLASTEDIVDHDVPILDCVGASGDRKAVVFGYACHNTTIPPDDLRYCGDWTGFAREQIERTNPGATALFIPGTAADQDPEPSGSIEVAREHGRAMADAVEQALGDRGVEVDGPIRSACADVPLPLRPVTQESLSEMLASNDPPQKVKARFLLDSLGRGEQLITSYSAPIQAVRFGDELVLVGLSGEPVVDWSAKLKRGAGGGEQGEGKLSSEPSLSAPCSPLIWVAGYCNDMFGYLPTRRVQAEGGYEGGRANLWSWIPAPFTDDVEDRISNGVRGLFNSLGLGTRG